MTTDEYVPSECEVRADFVRTHTRNFDSYLMGRSLTSEQGHYGAQFDAMIARVRRAAAREALDGLSAWLGDMAEKHPARSAHVPLMQDHITRYTTDNYHEETDR